MSLGGQSKSADSTPLKRRANGVEHSILRFLRTSSGDGVCTGGLVDVWCLVVFNRNPDSQDPEDSIEKTELRHLEWCFR